MIQRIQSMLLFIVVLCGIGLLIFPCMSFSYSEEKSSLINEVFFAKVSLLPLSVPNQMHFNYWYLQAVSLNILSIILSVISIFMFKRRKRQISLAYFIAGINGLLLLLIYLAETKESNSVKEYTVFYFLPVIAVIMAIAATRFIKKDEELVRSADRIR